MTGVLVDVCGARKAQEVMRSTWGHMDANPGTRYRGSIIFAEGVFGDDGVMALRYDFGNAGYGPWFYEGLKDWLYQQDTETGRLYRFEGTYRLGRDGVHIFDGEVTSVELGA